MFYGAVVWDPWLIVAQIVCLQCLYYLTLGAFLSFLVGTRVSRLSLVYFFDFATITTSTVTGWCVIASFLLSSIAGYPLYYPSFYMPNIWRLAFLNNMVVCEWYWSCSDGFARLKGVGYGLISNMDMFDCQSIRCKVNSLLFTATDYRGAELYTYQTDQHPVTRKN
ncbi:Protein SYS1 [Gossypium arboreum]|uniref:Protein SYS1 n=1 Tax=Gossypium arboreum TaxID=29729 RepID=A0A0B0PW73_GOSAR|nr:Protein SYS1 [Gossypium arboreum]